MLLTVTQPERRVHARKIVVTNGLVLVTICKAPRPSWPAAIRVCRSRMGLVCLFQRMDQGSARNQNFVPNRNSASDVAARRGYSVRSARAGSTVAARREGRKPASTATSAISRTPPAYTPGSAMETPKSWLRTARVASTATGIVMPIAHPARISTSRRMSPTTELRFAPSAMRIPISRVRCAVAYARIP